MQKTDGTSRCFAQHENIKRQSLFNRMFGDFPDIAINRSTFAAMCSKVLVEPTERYIPCWRAKVLARLAEMSEALEANDNASLLRT